MALSHDELIICLPEHKQDSRGIEIDTLNKKCVINCPIPDKIRIN